MFFWLLLQLTSYIYFEQVEYTLPSFETFTE